jgi:putative membrane protein
MAAHEDPVDATRRTRLANERTLLSWWRSGLTAYAVAFGVGKLVPDLTSGKAWPWIALGVASGLLGTVFFVYGWHRQRSVDAALARGEFAPPGTLMVGLLAFAGAAIGIAGIVVIVATR